MWNERWIVRCRGIPFKITKPDLEAWFDTSQLAGTAEECIHITYNDEGRPSGDCFMVFGDEASYYNALRKDKEYLQARYVEIFESDEDDLARALKQGGINKRDHGGTDSPIVKLRGLPFNASEADVQNFFSGLTIAKLQFRERDGKNTGEAYVKFGSQNEATAAHEKHMKPMGKRYIEIFKATTKEMQLLDPIDTRKIKKPPSNRLYSTYRGGVNEHKVFMRGIPFQASQGDVIKFFAPLMPKHIELTVGADGRPTGTAYSFFNSHEDAVLAMEKDKSNMDSRYVELFLESEEGETGMAADVAAQQAAALIAQAHGMPAPQVVSAAPASGALTADQLIAQAHGMVPPTAAYQHQPADPRIGQAHGAPPAMYGGPPDDFSYFPGQGEMTNYSTTQESYQQVYPTAQQPKEARPPVRKRLMIGAVQAFEEDVGHYNKRGKSDRGRGAGRGAGRGDGRGAGRGFRGRGGPYRRGASQGGSGIPPAAMMGGYQPKINPAKPRLLPSTFTLSGSNEETATNDTAYHDPNAAYQDPNAAYHDPNAAYQDPNAAYQDPNEAYQFGFVPQ